MNLLGAFKIALGVTILFWVIFFIGNVIPNFDTIFGLHPRTKMGLLQMFSCPFVHGNLQHIINNSLVFLALMTVSLYNGKAATLINSFLIIVISGIAVWLTGSPYSVHLGASGWIFGLFGCLVGNAFYRNEIKSLLIGIGIAIVYSGMFLGMFNFQNGISWQYHIFGFISGLMASRITRNIESD